MSSQGIISNEQKTNQIIRMTKLFCLVFQIAQKSNMRSIHYYILCQQIFTQSHRAMQIFLKEGLFDKQLPENVTI
jgi:UTP-glucose-1-phosphate uridylyltransferase